MLSAVGYVPFENIVGRAQMIFFSDCRGRARLDVLALADCGALESACSQSCDERRYACHPEFSDIRRAEPDSLMPAAKTAAEEEAQQGAPRPRPRTAAIEARIGHKFADPALLATAFTHVSALKPARDTAPTSYQRLEFLGDHVLGLIVSDMLYRAFPQRRRRRIVEAAGRSRAQGELRRCGEIARPARRHQARPGRRR